MSKLSLQLKAALRRLCYWLPIPENRRVPTGLATLESLLREGRLAAFTTVYPAKKHSVTPPICLDLKVHHTFREHLQWQQCEAVVAEIPQGRIWGRRGAIFTSDGLLIDDVSREFGAHKGVRGAEHPIFKQILLPKLTNLGDTVAAVATAGAGNFHHWLYDTIPRLHLLTLAGLDIRTMPLVIDYTGTSFQKESLGILGLSESNLICPPSQWSFHGTSARLVTTTLPSELSTVSDWVIPFLRSIFLTGFASCRKRRIYISRQRAPSRRLANEKQVREFLSRYGFETVFAEDQSITDTATLISEAEVVISVHGSGLSNLCFASAGVKVIDLLPPAHLDTYYWIMTNLIGGQYAYLFGEGERPPEAHDLVKNKVDDDLMIDVEKLRLLFNRLNLRQSTNQQTEPSKDFTP